MRKGRCGPCLHSPFIEPKYSQGSKRCPADWSSGVEQRSSDARKGGVLNAASSREAAQEWSIGRKPWVKSGTSPAPKERKNHCDTASSPASRVHHALSYSGGRAKYLRG